MTNPLYMDTDETHNIANSLHESANEATPNSVDEETTTGAADAAFGEASDDINKETNKHINATREIADNLRNTSNKIDEEDQSSAAATEKVDPTPSRLTSGAASSNVDENTSPQQMLAMLQAQRQQEQQQAQQQAAARNQAQYQQYVQQQQALAQQQAQQQQLAYNQQQQALAMQRQQQSALMAQQQAQALAAQGQNVNTITNSDGGYLIHKDDLARIIEEAQNSRAGDAALGDSSTDHRSASPIGDVPFTLGQASDAAALDPSEVTFEKDPENATLSDGDLDAVVNAALDANGVSDDPEVRGKWVEVMKYISENESNGVVNAANGWDSNAHGEIQEDGYPFNSSRGNWQCIPTTFAANHVPGTSTSIYDPTASCAASVNYLMGRYHCDPETGAGLDEFYNDRYPTYKGY